MRSCGRRVGGFSKHWGWDLTSKNSCYCTQVPSLTRGRRRQQPPEVPGDCEPHRPLGEPAVGVAAEHAWMGRGTPGWSGACREVAMDGGNVGSWGLLRREMAPDTCVQLSQQWHCPASVHFRAVLIRQDSLDCLQPASFLQRCVSPVGLPEVPPRGPDGLRGPFAGASAHIRQG